MQKETSINPDCHECGGDNVIVDSDNSERLDIKPCQLCLPEMWKDKSKKKTIYDKEYRTSMQKAADAEDPNLFNIDWSDFGPNKEEWEE